MASSVTRLPPPIMSEKAFLAAAWVSFGIAFSCVIMRTYIRWKAFKKIMDDDVFVFLAIAMFLATAILWQYAAGYMYELLDLSSGRILIPPPTFFDDFVKYLRASLGIILLYNTALWCVKFSFLLFFRKLGHNVRGIKIQWWCTFAYTVITYIVLIATVQYRCLTPDLMTIIQNCSGNDAVAFQRATLINNCVMDVTTDLAIVAIPIRMLWNVKIDIRQKLALAGIFLLVLITIAVSIVRTTAVAATTRQPEQSWLYFWNLVETGIAIVIVCLSSLRTLFTKQRKPTSSERGLMRSFFSSWNLWSTRGSRGSRGTRGDNKHSAWIHSSENRGIRLKESANSNSSQQEIYGPSVGIPHPHSTFA